MKIKMSAAILLLTTLLISTSQVVLADDGAAKIDAVRVALNTVDYEIDGRLCQGLPGLAKHKFAAKICAGLNKKLNDADNKLVEQKDGDAKKKLCDFDATLLKLANRRKWIISWGSYLNVYYPLMDAHAHVDPAQECEIR